MDNDPVSRRKTIGIVGPCGAGKSTLIKSLSNMGMEFRHIAQEHSYVGDMWKRITDPDVLIFLEADYAAIMERKSINFSMKEYQEQMRRLQHAHEHADLIINTTHLTPSEIVKIAEDFLQVARGDQK